MPNSKSIGYRSYIKYIGLDQLYPSYNFEVYQNDTKLVSKYFNEINSILENYMKSSICEGCMINDPSQDHHLCLTEDSFHLAERHLEDALRENSKYNVGDITHAFVEYKFNI